VRRIAVAALTLLALTGCESTQEKSARLARAAKSRPAEHGIVITRVNPDVRVLSTHLVHDRYGTAAVVELRSSAPQPQAALPLSIVVTGKDGKKEFSNDLPGLEDALTHVPLIAPREHLFWVNDQVNASTPKAVEAKVGVSTVAVPANPPSVKISGALKLEQDPDGAFTFGHVRNDSAVAQRKLVVYAVAERGGKIVAAGRAGIDRVPAHESRPFKVFWIGDPAGARVSAFVPPTVLKEGS
jgi:hypothetical protein